MQPMSHFLTSGGSLDLGYLWVLMLGGEVEGGMRRVLSRVEVPDWEEDEEDEKDEKDDEDEVVLEIELQSCC